MPENDDCEAKAAGGLLLARLAYLKQIGGARLLDEVIAQLAPDDAVVLRERVCPDAWYELALHERVDDAIASVVSPDDRASALIHLGREFADAILTPTLRPHFPERAPDVFLESVPRLYGAHYASTPCEYMKLDGNTGLIRTFARRRFARPDYCWSVVGWLQRGLELFGADAALVTEASCRASGAPCCEYRCEWY